MCYNKMCDTIGAYAVCHAAPQGIRTIGELAKMGSIKEIWDGVLSIMRQGEISQAAYDIWISCIEPRGIENGEMVVCVNTEFQKRTVETEYADKLREALRQVLGVPIGLRVVSREVAAKTPAVVTVGRFAAGDALSAVFLGDGEMLYSWCDWISPRERNVDKAVAYPFMKTLNGWRKRGGKNYLHFGRAVKPVTVVCGENKYKLEDGRSYLKVPEVTSSAYEYRGKTVQFLINYNLHKVTAELLREATFYFDDKLKTAKRGRTIEIPALSVVMAELS